MGRVRRTTVKAIDYGKEQEFSDDDLFEDKEAEAARTPQVKRRGRARKSDAFDTSDNGIPLEDFSPEDIKLRYTEKGYDPNQPHLRERFTFMPELEQDGSRKVELIVGRRLIQQGEDQADPSVHDDENEVKSTGGEKKTRKKKGAKGTKKEEKDAPAKHHAEYEYLIKYRGVSYLHLEWKSASELESMNKSAKNLYRRYLKKIHNGGEEGLEDPDFDQGFIQPQRVVDEDDHEEIVELDDKELIEWEKQQALENGDGEDSDEEDPKENKKSLPQNNVQATAAADPQNRE